MTDVRPPGRPPAAAAGVDWSALYDAHPEYTARRDADSYERALVDLEVRRFKLPNLLALLQGWRPASVLEIGCATGELLAAFPVAPGGRRVGLDISEQNVRAAQARFPDCSFAAGDFRDLAPGAFDLVLLSDVLEHVPDDVAFLAAAARCGRRVLLNLPLEDNWLNRGRAYGPGDVSGHLRAYSLDQGLALVSDAGLHLERWARVWIHESPAERERRALRAVWQGQAFSGGVLGRSMRRLAFDLATAVRPVGRRLFASNLFALAHGPG